MQYSEIYILYVAVLIFLNHRGRMKSAHTCIIFNINIKVCLVFLQHSLVPHSHLSSDWLTETYRQ